jgi:ligand-binding sensor domain-containing protein
VAALASSGCSTLFRVSGLRARPGSLANASHFLDRAGRAPQDINALAKTPDGVLWIGSTGGLFTFDGITFSPFRPTEGEPRLPSNPVDGLLATPSGELWVEGVYVGAARIVGGHVTVFDRFDGEKVENLANLHRDSQGTMWAMVGTRQLVQLGNDNVWHRTENPLPRPGLITAFFIDSADTHWVVEDGVLYRRSKKDVHFRPTIIRSKTYVRLREDADHTLWGSGANSAKCDAIQRIGVRQIACFGPFLKIQA